MLVQQTKRQWPAGDSLQWANRFPAGGPLLGHQWTVIWVVAPGIQHNRDSIIIYQQIADVSICSLTHSVF